ncbi:MAG: 3-deoxy-7-phosphoheptulonate synthase [Bacteroidetes bacterium]|nr:3-deoxy-7-phosphoheptulonate synthase [Bacteroidota bacterium]
MENKRKPYQLVSREWKKEDTVISLKNTTIGGNNVCLIAGPCAVENEDQIFTICEFLSKKNIKLLRGGAYKPRTSPYSFQGLKKDGLILMRQAADKYGMGVVTEVMETNLVDEVYQYADILQVGTRNMQNYQLLRALSKIDKPILLKRGMSSTLEEWLLAAEYILSGGNEKVILCERGIRTFETATRNTLDLSIIPLVKALSHLPIIADPSQGTGIRELVTPMSMAAIVAGADGIMVEVHNHPEEALSDGPQSLYFDQFAHLMEKVEQSAHFNNRAVDYAVDSRLVY